MRHIRSLSVVVLLAGLTLALSACGGGGGSVPGDAVAQVGDQTVTKSEFDQLMQRAKENYKANQQTFPKQGSAQYQQLKDQAVQFLVDRAEFAQEAKKLGVDVSEQDVQNRLDQIKKQFFKGNEKKYQQQLKAQGLTEQQVKSDIHDRLISEKLYNKITSDVKVTPAQVTAYYNAHKTQYVQPESRTVRHILIAVCGASTPGGVKCRSHAKAKAFAEKLFHEIKNGANFARLAKKYSGDPGSASQGGKLTITRGQTVATFDQTAFTLGVGTVSAPIETQYGFHIIEPLGPVKPATKTPFNQVKTSIQQTLLQQKKQAKMAQWVQQLRKDFKVKYAAGYQPASTGTTGTTGSSTVPATTSAATTTSG